MKRTAVFLLAAVSAFAQKQSISVEAFDYSTVLTAVQAIFGTQLNIGEGCRALMVKRIADGGKLTVVERKKIESLMKEQDFGASGRVKRGTNARIGQIRGADLTLMGDIVVFGRDDRRVGGAAAGAGGGFGGAIGGYKQEGKAVVVLNYRIASTETSEIINTGEARGESKRVSRGAGGFFFGPRGGGGGSIDMTAANFAETIIGEAVVDAVDKLAAQLNSGSFSSSGTSRLDDIDARVASFENGTIIINAGANEGLTSGLSFTVYRKGKEIKDPVTGEVLDVQTDAIGKITVTTVREKIAMGTYQGAQPPRVGDIVRK